MGYTENSGIYRVYNEERKVATKEPRHRSPDEQSKPIGMEFISQNEHTSRSEDTSRSEYTSRGGDASRSKGELNFEAESKPQVRRKRLSPIRQHPARRSARGRGVPGRYWQDGERAYVVSTTSQSVKDALVRLDGAPWIAAIGQEKEQLKKYGVHEELDRLAPGKRTVDTKWVPRGSSIMLEILEKRQKVVALSRKRSTTPVITTDHDGTRKLTQTSPTRAAHGQVHTGAEKQDAMPKRFTQKTTQDENLSKGEC